MLFRIPVLMENSYNFNTALIIILQSNLQNTLVFMHRWCHLIKIRRLKNMGFQNDCLFHCRLHCQKPTLGKMMKLIIRDALHLPGLLSLFLLPELHKESPDKDSDLIYNSLLIWHVLGSHTEVLTQWQIIHMLKK